MGLGASPSGLPAHFRALPRGGEPEEPGSVAPVSLFSISPSSSEDERGCAVRSRHRRMRRQSSALSSVIKSPRSRTVLRTRQAFPTLPRQTLLRKQGPRKRQYTCKSSYSTPTGSRSIRARRRGRGSCWPKGEPRSSGGSPSRSSSTIGSPRIRSCTSIVSRSTPARRRRASRSCRRRRGRSSPRSRSSTGAKRSRRRSWTAWPSVAIGGPAKRATAGLGSTTGHGRRDGSRRAWRAASPTL